MKKVALYSLGGLILVGLAGFWVYSFLYGSPTNNAPAFANFDFFGGEAPAAEPLPVFVPTEPVVDVTTESLRQLTTKPVVGMRVIEIGSTPTMRYVEAGTGHIFDINLEAGVEERVSSLSVPNAQKAIVSDTGEFVIITTTNSARSTSEILSLGNSTPIRVTTIQNISSVAFGPNNTLLFVEPTTLGSQGVRYDLLSKTRSTLFTTPLVDIAVSWGVGTSSPHLVTTKSAHSLTGYSYLVNNNQWKRAKVGPGLASLLDNTGYYFQVVTETGDLDIYRSNYTGQTYSIGLSTPIDKCVSAGNERLFCGADSDYQGTDPLPDAWYMGKVRLVDRLYSISSEGVVQQILDPKAMVGRDIDITNLQYNPVNKMVYFINKNDSTLWLYETQ